MQFVGNSVVFLCSAIYCILSLKRPRALFLSHVHIQTLAGAPLVVGIVTILKQFHPSSTDKLLSLFGQFVKCTIHSNFKDLRKPGQLSLKVLLLCMVALLLPSQIPYHVPHAMLCT